MITAVELWWGLSALSVAFVVIDWSHARLDRAMYLGFILITAFMGPLALVLYLLVAREPLPGTHRRYIAAQWKQTVGSTFHCVAGDSVGIVGAAVLTRLVQVPPVWELAIEYAAGFLVGWLVAHRLKPGLMSTAPEGRHGATYEPWPAHTHQDGDVTRPGRLVVSLVSVLPLLGVLAWAAFG